MLRDLVRITAAAILLAAPATASAAGTITVNAGGARSATDTDSAYAVALGGVSFELAPHVADPASAAWSAMCDTDASGACTSASVDNGRYLVRETPDGAPVGWSSFPTIAWGSPSGGVSDARPYVGDANVKNGNVVVHPATTSPTQANVGSGPFITAADNPKLPSTCGLDILLLLDRSGSIDPAKDVYKAAAQQFISTLAGTPTHVKIFSFAATATQDQAVSLDLEQPADVAAANAMIASVYASPSGSTNWDEGLQLAATAALDAVVFITDGNPTVRESNSGNSSVVDVLDVSAGVAAANSVKASATMLAVGAGADVTAANLAAVSGPVANQDYFTAAVDQLGAKLQQVANALCGSRIHLRKLTDESAGARAGWELAAAKPAGSPVAVTASSAATIGIPARIDVAVDHIPAAGATGITVTETAQAGYEFVASACQKGGYPDPSSGGATTVTIDSVARNEDWYCSFRNRKLSAGSPNPGTPGTPGAPGGTVAPGGSGATPPTGAVLGDVANGCEGKPFRSLVPGRGLKSVTFKIDKKVVATIKKKDAKGRFTLRVDPRKFADGPHTMSARLVPRKGKARVVPLRSFTPCGLGKCVSRRAFKIRVKKVRRDAVVTARVYVNRKRVKIIRGKRLHAPVTLTGLPQGRFKVRVVSKLRSGRTKVEVRTYRTCVKRDLKPKT
jgi:hypothetical protein